MIFKSIPYLLKKFQECINTIKKCLKNYYYIIKNFWLLERVVMYSKNYHYFKLRICPME